MKFDIRSQSRKWSRNEIRRPVVYCPFRSADIMPPLSTVVHRWNMTVRLTALGPCTQSHPARQFMVTQVVHTTLAAKSNVSVYHAASYTR